MDWRRTKNFTSARSRGSINLTYTIGNKLSIDKCSRRKKKQKILSILIRISKQIKLLSRISEKSGSVKAKGSALMMPTYSNLEGRAS
jgi:hypothetical protein